MNARIKALEHVAEALEHVAELARLLIDNAGLIHGRTPEDADTYIHEREHGQALLNALQELDDAEEKQPLEGGLNALPAAPEPARGEVVEVVAFEDKSSGEVRQFRVNSKGARETHDHWGYNTLGTTRLPLVKGDGA
jgi:hypothetical protein